MTETKDPGETARRCATIREVAEHVGVDASAADVSDIVLAMLFGAIDAEGMRCGYQVLVASTGDDAGEQCARMKPSATAWRAAVVVVPADCRMVTHTAVGPPLLAAPHTPDKLHHPAHDIGRVPVQTLLQPPEGTTPDPVTLPVQSRVRACSQPPLE